MIVQITSSESMKLAKVTKSFSEISSKFSEDFHQNRKKRKEKKVSQSKSDSFRLWFQHRETFKSKFNEKSVFSTQKKPRSHPHTTLVSTRIWFTHIFRWKTLFSSSWWNQLANREIIDFFRKFVQVEKCHWGWRSEGTWHFPAGKWDSERQGLEMARFYALLKIHEDWGFQNKVFHSKFLSFLYIFGIFSILL